MTAPDGLRSMTGHGAGTAEVFGATIALEVRAVNQRHLEVRVRLPPELADHAGLVEEQVRRRLGRGRVEVTGRVEGPWGAAASMDVARAQAAVRELVALRDALAPSEPVPLSLLAAVPDLFRPTTLPDAPALAEAITHAAARACAALDRMRLAEGAALAQALGDQLTQVEALVADAEARAPRAVELARAKLRERIARLLEGTAAPLDHGRLELEVAIAADRMDATEECARLRSHAAQFRTWISPGGDDARGRRLDFLLQEMTREANTLGSKSGDAETSRLAVELKAAIERLREQIQNVL